MRAPQPVSLDVHANGLHDAGHQVQNPYSILARTCTSIPVHTATVLLAPSSVVALAAATVSRAITAMLY